MGLTASRRMSSGRTGLASQSSPPGVGLPLGKAPRSCTSMVPHLTSPGIDEMYKEICQRRRCAKFTSANTMEHLCAALG